MRLAELFTHLKRSEIVVLEILTLYSATNPVAPMIGRWSQHDSEAPFSSDASSVGTCSLGSHAVGGCRRIPFDQVNRRLNRGGVNLKTEQSFHETAFQLDKRGFFWINVRIGFEPLNGSEDSFSERTVSFYTTHQHTTKEVDSER